MDLMFSFDNPFVSSHVLPLPTAVVPGVDGLLKPCQSLWKVLVGQERHISCILNAV